MTPRSSSSSCSSTALMRLPLWRERDLAARAVGALRALHRLGVLPGVGAGRRVAHVPDRELAGERAQVVLAEDLADEAELAAGDDVPAAVGGGDARRLLAAVLERVQREVRQTRHLVPGRVQAEHAALVARSLTHRPHKLASPRCDTCALPATSRRSREEPGQALGVDASRAPRRPRRSPRGRRARPCSRSPPTRPISRTCVRSASARERPPRGRSRGTRPEPSPNRRCRS